MKLVDENKISSLPRAFTFIELLGTVVVIAIITLAAVVFIGNYISTARLENDKRTLVTLNDALNRYKTQGGALTGLTQGAPISNVLTRLATTLSWAGMQHQVISSSYSYPARSLSAQGSGRNYRFTRANSYNTTATNYLGNASIADLEITNWAGNDTATFASGAFRLNSGMARAGSIVRDGAVYYILDATNPRVYKIDEAGIMTIYTTLPAGSTEYMALGPDGYLYAANASNGTIYRITAPSTYAIYAGTGTSGYSEGFRTSAQFTYTMGMCWDNAGNMYITEFNQGRIRKIDATTGNTSTIATGLGSSLYGIVYSATQNALYTGRGGAVSKYPLPSGPNSNISSGLGQGYSIAIDSADNIYFADRGNHIVGKIPSGTSSYTVIAGSSGVSGLQNGAASSSLLFNPNGLCFDSDGNLLIGYYGNTTGRYVRKLYLK